MSIQPRTLVVGAAIVRHGAVLAARRTAPPEAAGRWEFPGGKVETGESPEEALVREIAEELGCRIGVRSWLPGSAEIGDTHELRVACGVLLEGEPAPTEHDALRWVDAHHLDSLDWLEPDRPFLPHLRLVLQQCDAGSVRAVFFDEGDALAVARRLVADGFEAWAERERFAGEDDDEGHPWAVITDAPDFVLEVIVENYDAWLDVEPPASTSPPTLPPIELPLAPRRIKKP